MTATVSSDTKASAASLLVIALWFCIVTGAVEGVSLMFFQRVNWAAWARVMHVSWPIVWVSPVVVTSFFVVIALAVWILSRLIARVPAIRALVFIFTFLGVYDWLATTGRLYRTASILLGLGVAAAFIRWLGKHEVAALGFWKRSLPWVITAFIIVMAVIRGGSWLQEREATHNLPPAVPGSPNVLVIVIDTLRADHLSSYGYGRPTSPNMDQIAKRGVLFENAIAPSSWSLPSHASLLTGRPVSEHGMGNVQPMPWMGWGNKAMNGYLTLGEALEARGYRTGAFSANRVYFTDNVGLGRGFMHFDDYFNSVADGFVRTQFGRWVSRLYLNRSEKSKVTRALRYLHLDALLEKDSEGSGDYGGCWGVRKLASDVNDETLRWINHDRTRPFFAFLNYLDVHYAYGGPHTYPKPRWDHGSDIDEYDAGIVYEDDYIGRLVHELEREQLAESTILVITSDHGESLGDHGLSYHGGALYRELLRVPLIVFYPRHTPEGMRVSQPVANAALPATLMEMLGGSQAFPGPSLGLLWKSQAPPEMPDVLSELPQTDSIVAQDRKMQGRIPLATDGSMESVVTPRWQLITHSKDGDQLYEWVHDPAESNNLAGTPGGGEVIRELKLKLGELRSKKE